MAFRSACSAGETLCIVGESGCGKSTVAKLILRLMTPSGGRIVIEGTDITTLDAAAMRPFRQRAQMVFQDPYSSLNPRLTAEQIVTEPIENFQTLSRGERRDRAAGLLARVGLGPGCADANSRSSSPAASASGSALRARWR